MFVPVNVVHSDPFSPQTPQRSRTAPDCKFKSQPTSLKKAIQLESLFKNRRVNMIFKEDVIPENLFKKIHIVCESKISTNHSFSDYTNIMIAIDCLRSIFDRTIYKPRADK